MIIQGGSLSRGYHPGFMPALVRFLVAFSAWLVSGVGAYRRALAP
jgi:hypothetical protein